jgi:hypothetical protein
VPWAEELIAEADGVPVGFMQLIGAAEETHYWVQTWSPVRGRSTSGSARQSTVVGHRRGDDAARADRCFDVHGASAVLLDPRSDNPVPTALRAPRILLRRATDVRRRRGGRLLRVPAGSRRAMSPNAD